MKSLKQLEVQIMGQSYLLGCPEGGEQRMLEAVEKVDFAMCKIRDGGKVKARDRIAVLAALNLAYEMAARPVAAAAAPDGVSASELAAKTGNENAVSHPGLTGLLQKLDRALADDGRLL